MCDLFEYSMIVFKFVSLLFYCLCLCLLFSIYDHVLHESRWYYRGSCGRYFRL